MGRRAQRTPRGKSGSASSQLRNTPKPFDWKRIGLAVLSVLLLLGILAVLWPLPEESGPNFQQSSPRQPKSQHSRSNEQAPLPPPESIDSLERELGLHAAAPDTAENALDFGQLEQEITAQADLVVKEYPEDFQAWHLAGKIYGKYKQSEPAELRFKRALEIAPNDLQVRQDLADVLLQVGRNADAVAVLSEATTLVPNFETQPDFSHALAESLMGVGRLDEARQLLTTMLEDSPDSPLHWISLGKVELQKQEFALAEASFRRALALDETSEAAWLSLCQALAFQRKTEEAAGARKQLEALRQTSLAERESFEEEHLLSLRRFAASSFRSLAVIRQNHGDSVQAQLGLERSLALEPSNLLTLSHLMVFHRNRGEFPAAADIARRILKLQPDLFSHYVNLANLSMEQADPHTAELALRLAAQRELADGQAQLSLAQFMLMLKRPVEAIAPARSAVQEMGSLDARLVLISALNASGRTGEAQAELDHARMRFPRDPRLGP